MNPEQKNEPTEQTGPTKSDIAEKAAARRGRLFDPTGKVESLTAGETLIADVRRHPFGLFVLYFQITVALGLSLGIILFLLPGLSDTLGIDSVALNSIAAFFALIVISLGLIFTVLATRIYRSNQLIVSDKNVTQVLQIGLFNRKVSELSMGNVEDVTAQQSGIFPTLFHYGILRIETAGEQNNFTFIYCPNPNAYAKAILDARLQFLERNGSE